MRPSEITAEIKDLAGDGSVIKNLFITEPSLAKSLQVVGLEPTCGCPRQILSLLRLPFRHTC